MKIDPTKNGAGAIERGATRGPRTETAKPAGGETVAIGSVASQLARLESQLSAGFDVDVGKVEAIKDAIREGRMQVNPEVVADKLIASAQDLLR